MKLAVLLIKTVFVGSFLLMIGCGSTQPSYFKTVATPMEDETEYVRKGDENISIATKYVDDNGDFLIFEFHVINGTDSAFHFSYDHLSLVYTDTIGFIHSEELACVNKTEVVKEIDTEIDNYKDRRKEANTQNAIFTGINILFAAVGAGNGYDIAATSLDGLIVGTEINSLAGRDLASLRKYRDYIDEWVLHEHIVQPDQSASWDILFPTSNYTGSAQIQLLNKDFDETFEFSLSKQKVK